MEGPRDAVLNFDEDQSRNLSQEAVDASLDPTTVRSPTASHSYSHHPFIPAEASVVTI